MYRHEKKAAGAPVRARRPQVREQEMVTARHHRQSHHHPDRRQGNPSQARLNLRRAEMAAIERRADGRTEIRRGITSRSDMS
jgi:hypothetical protein